MPAYGLTSENVREIQSKIGFNEIEVKNKRTVFRIFFSQYIDVFSILLLASAVLSASMTYFGFGNSYIDFILIISILLINGLIGTFQEYKAEKTLDKLKDMQRTYVRVYRDDKLIKLDSRELVPGDMIVLEEGEKISADCKIQEGNLTLDESSFTGESYPVIRGRDEEIYSGTFVINGKARLKVISTGQKTKFGELAVKVANMDEASFFKRQLNTFTSKLIRYIIVIIIIFFGVGLLKGNSIGTILLASVALGVAVVPEGLAATTVITMMNGIKSLVSKDVLVRKIDSIEVLGAVDYVVFDKTGTLTCGDLKVREMRGQSNLPDVLGYYAIPNSLDLVDTSLIDYAKTRGFDSHAGKIVEVKPFDYSTRCSSVVWEINARQIEFVKGSPEEIFKKCGKIIDIQPYLEKGFRVLAFARKEATWQLIGVVAFEDPLRKEAKKAIDLMKIAGIKPVIITGDHEKTAKFIASQLGLSSLYISGEKLRSMKKEEAYKLMKDGGVVYRALPETKLYLVDVYQTYGKVVASTGDGVNDVLLLKKADVGIAMGKRGTDVAKESADIVLLNDSLLTIVNGIIEGRGIIQNVRKFITFLLTCNLSEAVVNLIFPFLSYKIVLDAPKLLWINLVTDGFPALAFGFDKVDKEIIQSAPEKFRYLLTEKMKKTLFCIGIMTAILISILFYFSAKYFDFAIVVTIIFSVIVFSEFLKVFLIRHIFREAWFSNRYMTFAILISIILQLIMIYTPLGKLFGFTILFGFEWLIILTSLVILFSINMGIAHLIRRDLV